MERIDPLELISDPKLAQLLNLSLRSFARWDAEAGNDFPKPVYINRRKFRRRGEIEEWLRRCARDSLAARVATTSPSKPIPPKAIAKQPARARRPL
jgi:predicted DNA-binding transcriptional regulator AlpA